MRSSALLLPILLGAALGCKHDAPSGLSKVTPEPPPPPPPPRITSFYVSPTGSTTGSGTLADPWSLRTALAHPPVVQPGDTIWLRGGTYQGNFSSKLTGTPDKPVVLRQYPGERASIDGRFDITGSHAWYWGFEVTYSDPRRVTQQTGSDPTNLPRERVTVFVTGPFNRLINLVVHDLGDGLFSGVSAEGLEIYGSLFYNNGWDAPDRGHGHSVYLQNAGAAKRVVDNVMFGSFSSGLKIGGSDAASLLNFHVEGNTSFESGGPVLLTKGYSHNMHAEGGGGKLGGLVFDRNSFYHANGNAHAFRLNCAGCTPGQDVTFTQNTVHGQSFFHEFRSYRVTNNKFTTGRNLIAGQDALVALRAVADVELAAHAWDGNQYAAPAASPKKPFYLVLPGKGGTVATLDEWRRVTGYDGRATYTAGEYMGADVIVRPNQYERGRAFITVWNWQLAPVLPIDVTGVLVPGDEYVVHHVFDVFGAPVLAGRYDGTPLLVPQAPVLAPEPLGFAGRVLPTGPKFNVFLLRKTS